MVVALRAAAEVPTGNPTTGGTVTIQAVLGGDDLFLTLTSRDSVAGTWAKIANSTDHKLTVWWKRAQGTLGGASNTAGKTLTVAGCVGSCSFVLKPFSGTDQGTPYADIAVDTNISGNEIQTGFTPSMPDSMVCCAVANYNNDNAVTSLSFATLGATTMTEKLSTGGSDCANAFGHVLQSGGPTATGDLTWAQTDGVTYSVVWTIKADPNKTFALTGQAVTASAGTLSISRELSITGQAVAASAGTLTATMIAIATHRRGGYAMHAYATVPYAQPVDINLSPDVNVSLTGQAVTASAGSVVASHSQALTGQAVTVSAGSVTISRIIPLSGEQVTATPGSVSVNIAGSLSLQLTGQAVTVSAGNLSISRDFPLTGQAVTASAGTMVYGINPALTGQAVTVVAGTVTVSTVEIPPGHRLLPVFF